MSKQKTIFICLVVLVVLTAGFLVYFGLNKNKRSPKSALLPTIPSLNMKLTSPAFENNGFIPSKYTCDGEDINPPLEIQDVPEKAKSLVLIVDDPDAPMGTWVHWVVWNIDPTTEKIEENQVPEGAVEGLNDFKKHSYGGPCPPSGTHHYHFKLYALNKTLEIDSSSEKEDVEKAMADSIIAQAELVGLYQRQ